MSKWTMAFIMHAQVHCFRIGPMLSTPFCPHYMLYLLTLSRIKTNLHSSNIIVSGNHWPIFLYAGYVYNAEDPWKDLFKSQILILVNISLHRCLRANILIAIVYAYKHVFTSPSLVDEEVKVTWSGNTQIHGMMHVTPASIAYITTQVCQCSCSVHPGWPILTGSICIEFLVIGIIAKSTTFLLSCFLSYVGSLGKTLKMFLRYWSTNMSR